MKKTTIPLISVLVLLLAGLVVLSLILSPNASMSNPPATESKTDALQTEFQEPLQIFEISLDYSVSHTDFKSLVADSEIIITGTIKEITGYSTWDVPIQSRITVGIEDVIKGDVKKGGALTYRELGGRMSAIEWVKANAEKIKGKGPEKEYENTLASLKPADIYKATVFSVKNAEVGDRYLLFLRYDFINDLYLVIGMSCNGRFNYDETTQSYFRPDDNGTMKIELSELKALAETTPDNSAKLRASDEEGYRQYLAELENPADEDITWNEITPKLPNPAYGKEGE